ncbi:hypothetical protein NCC49_006000 [Naganishia albida]|nr:hypothetical protein NCC49_006000 [Naganishia albida]
MDRSDIPALKAQVKNVVRQADAKGDIDAGRFTVKIAKQEIAKALGIDVEVLNQKQWKQLVKELVHTAIEDIGTLKSSPAKHPSPKKTEEFILDLLSDEDRAQKRKSKPSSSRRRHESEESDESPRPAARKKTKVVSESEESDAPRKAAKKKADVNGKGKKKSVSSAPVISESDSDSDVKPEKTVKKTGSTNGKGKKPVSSAVISDTDEDVSDVKPKKRIKKKEAVDVKGKKKANSATSASSSTAPAVEDERVKELKSIVVACGVRKQWKKEFQDMNTPEEQISHLKRLLTSLGMKGQPTKAKAKVIKEKRELAAELGDVLEFEAKRGLGITGGGRSNENGRAEEEPAESPIKPRKARTSAARNKVPSMTYVGSDESSEVDSEDGECQGQQGSGPGSQSASGSGSDSEAEGKKAVNGKQARRNMASLV